MKNIILILVVLTLVGFILAEEDPCEPFNPPVPNFNAPGRRISVAKCYEYIWNIKYRMDKEQREFDCKNSRSKFTFHIYVIGGRNAAPTEYPHMAAIGWKAADDSWTFRCGGSLISEKFVLTAAHCTRASSLDTTLADVMPKIVRLGDKNIDHTPKDNKFIVDAKIIRIISYPRYNPPKKYFDIALIEIEHYVTFSKDIQPACLWTNPDDNSYKGKVTVTGWGVVAEESQKTSSELQVATVDLIDRKTCNNLLQSACSRKFCGLQDHQLCAGKMEGGVDTCQGDSGGPLQIEIELPTTSQGKMHYVIGVTSFGQGCAREKSPGVYTRVASFIDWIESIVWE